MHPNKVMEEKIDHAREQLECAIWQVGMVTSHLESLVEYLAYCQGRLNEVSPGEGDAIVFDALEDEDGGLDCD